ncbi:MAG TPA: STAS domain-containing protein [Blastocatellia bacterium]|nr:STAS domain-containing protein [Blastocatellia bacterium]
MTIRITQGEDIRNGRMILKLEGIVDQGAGDLLEKMCSKISARPESGIVINLSGVTFVDEAGAAALCRLKKTPGIAIDGCHLFTERMLERQ